MVLGAGVEPLTLLHKRELLIPRLGKNRKTGASASPGYTAGTGTIDTYGVSGEPSPLAMHTILSVLPQAGEVRSFSFAGSSASIYCGSGCVA
jgi:hypothetical protein